MAYNEYYRYIDKLTGMRIVDEETLEWINDGTIQRMFGVGQLGLCRERPTLNPRMRGEHSVSTGLAAMFEARVNKFPIEDQRKALVFGIYHDAHPAGGDGLKGALGTNEESVSERYFFEGEPGKRFKERCSTWGWDDVVVKGEILAMIGRQSETPIGQLVHGSDKRRADMDFLNYTLGDLAFGSGFARVSSSMHPECEGRSGPGECPVIGGLVTVGVENARIIEGGEFGSFRRINTQVFSIDDFNIFPRMKWEEKGAWYLTDSETFAHYVIAAAMLHNTLYFHPGMQGPEFMLARGIDRLGIKEEIKRLAMTYDDKGLSQILAGHGLDYWIGDRAHDGWGYVTQTDEERLKPGEYRMRLPKFNYRMETPVRDEKTGEVAPFVMVRPDVVGFVEELFGRFGDREVLLVDNLWEERPAFAVG